MWRLTHKAKWLLGGALFLIACGAAQEQQNPKSPESRSIAEGEVCPSSPAANPGETPSCPDGCEWNGTECRAKRPIVVYDKPILPTSTAPTAPAPTSTAPSSP